MTAQLCAGLERMVDHGGNIICCIVQTWKIYYYVGMSSSPMNILYVQQSKLTTTCTRDDPEVRRLA